MANKNKKDTEEVKNSNGNTASSNNLTEHQTNESSENTPNTILPAILAIGLVLVGGYIAYKYFTNQNFIPQNLLPTLSVQETEESGNNDSERDIISGRTEREAQGEQENARPTVPQDQNFEVMQEPTTQPDTTTKLSEWTANDYKKGDISTGSYTVVSGDTLWELAEGAYGDGTQWTRILDANSAQIAFLPNGQQALIFPGQVLNIP